VKYHASHFNKPYKLFEEGVEFPSSSDIALWGLAASANIRREPGEIYVLQPVCKASDLYLEGYQFKSQLWCRQSWLRLFVVFLCSSKHMLVYHLKLAHGIFCPHP
jgi:hypothetical protein